MELETSAQSIERFQQCSLRGGSGLTGRCCGNFGREPCWNLAEQGYSHRTIRCSRELGTRFPHPDSDRRLTPNRSPRCSKSRITRGGKLRSGGNKLHGVPVRQCRNSSGLHEIAQSYGANETIGVKLAVGGIIGAAVCIADTCKEAVVFRDGLDGW